MIRRSSSQAIQPSPVRFANAQQNAPRTHKGKKKTCCRLGCAVAAPPFTTRRWNGVEEGAARSNLHASPAGRGQAAQARQNDSRSGEITPRHPAAVQRPPRCTPGYDGSEQKPGGRYPVVGRGQVERSPASPPLEAGQGGEGQRGSGVACRQKNVVGGITHQTATNHK